MHHKSIHAVVVMNSDSVPARVVTGSMDGWIKILSLDDLSIQQAFKLRKIYPTLVHAGVKCLQVSRDLRKLLVGTGGGEVVELFVNSGRCVQTLLLR